MALSNFRTILSATCLAVVIIGSSLLLLKDYNGQISRGGRAPRFILESRDSVNVSGIWSEWQESTCTFTTSMGCVAFRKRDCDPSDGKCEGSKMEWIDCTSSNCPALWTEWISTKFGKDKCVNIRERNCTDVPNANCSGYDTQSHFCDVSVWSSWSQWTCHHAKDEYCHNQRDRECLIGLDLSTCVGNSSESIPCSPTVCKDYFVLQWSEWSAWSCNDVLLCFKTRTRSCSTGKDQDCDGEPKEVVDCDSCEGAVRWLQWSPWACVQTHGINSLHRVRNCSTGDADDCHGKPYGIVGKCNQTSCPECYPSTSLPTTVSVTAASSESSTLTSVMTTGTSATEATTTSKFVGSWLEWSQTVCTNLSGTISANRVRNCSTGNNDMDTDCEGTAYDTKLCLNGSCSECLNESGVYWHEWESWSCELHSGVTFRVRFRTCSTGNDRDCLIYGDNNQLKQCTSTTCPECYGLTPSTTSTQSIVSTTTPAIDTCSDAEHDKCLTDELLSIVCADSQLAAKYCQKSCNLCESVTTSSTASPTQETTSMTEPAFWSSWTHWECSHAHSLTFRIRYRDCLSGACAVDDNHSIEYCDENTCPECFSTLGEALEYCRDEEDQCNNTEFRDIVCKDPALATRYCSKSCNLCVPEDKCKDGSGCDAELGDLACGDSTLILNCPILCGLCVLPEKCFEGPECRPELKAQICFNSVNRLKCPILCSLCDPTPLTTPTIYTSLTTRVSTASTATSSIGSTGGSLSTSTDNSGDSNGPTTASGTISSSTDNSGDSNGPTTASVTIPTSTDNSGVTNRPTTASGAITSSTDTSSVSSEPTIASETISSSTDNSSVTNGPTAVSGPISSSTDNSGVTSGPTTVSGSMSNSTDSSGVTNGPTAASGSISTSTDNAGVTNRPTTASGAITSSADNSSVSSEPTTASETISSSTDNSSVTNGPTGVSGPISSSTGNSGVTSGPTTASETISSSTDNSGISNLTTTASGAISSSTDNSGVTNGPTTVSGIISGSTDNSGVSNGPTNLMSNSTDSSGSSSEPTTASGLITSSPGHSGVTSDPATPAPVTEAPTTHTEKTTTPLVATTVESVGGHTIAPIPTKCAVCVGPPELCDQLYDVQPCDPPNNYCINHVKNNEDGSREITRSCGNHRTCYREWFQGSSDNDKCQNFVEDNVVTLAFECTYCCIKDACNVQLYPALETLYQDV